MVPDNILTSSVATPTRVSAAPTDYPQHGYADFERLVAARVASINDPVFTTDVKPGYLWSTYLNWLPQHRQHYDCRTCERFIETYGSIVTIDVKGSQRSIIWTDDIESLDFFRGSVGMLRSLISRCTVTGVFLWDKANWGVARTGQWSHIHGKPARDPFTHPTLDANQMMAEKREDYGVLCRSLADFPRDVALQAARVLAQEALYRSEKSSAIANWFLELHDRLAATKNERNRDNIIWLAVATAPVGFTHVRTTVLGTLLEDLKAGMSFDAVSKRWAQKLHPLQYQRPQAAPSEGQIREAEKLVETLGIAKSLERRFARLTDVLKFEWLPPMDDHDAERQPGGVFSHLRPVVAKSSMNAIQLPNQKMTWEKFQRTILPSALSIEAVCPAVGPYYGLVTATHPDAPPIIQWDGLEGEKRNPVSWYFYHGGSHASRWNLPTYGGRIAVTAIFCSPPAWQQPEKFVHQGEQVFFALAGCKEYPTAKPSLTLFPEILKSELRAARSVIEAHSKTGVTTGAADGDANGIAFPKDSPLPLTLHVRTAGGTAIYTLDRWD